jgi:hypothetical protein
MSASPHFNGLLAQGTKLRQIDQVHQQSKHANHAPSPTSIGLTDITQQLKNISYK